MTSQSDIGGLRIELVCRVRHQNRHDVCVLNQLSSPDSDRSYKHATAYGGTVISWAVRSLNPRPAVMLGVKRERLEKGVDIPK